MNEIAFLIDLETFKILTAFYTVIESKIWGKSSIPVFPLAPYWSSSLREILKKMKRKLRESFGGSLFEEV